MLRIANIESLGALLATTLAVSLMITIALQPAAVDWCVDNRE
jgi:hypothetical protein